MILKNMTYFTGEIFLKGQMVRLGDGIVKETGVNLIPDPEEEVVDLEEDYLVPGFVDVHIHAFQGSDTMQGEDAVRSMSRGLSREGVAAFCPTTMSASAEDTCSAVAGIRAVMQRQEPGGAKVLGANLESPFLSEAKAGAQRKEFFSDPSWETLLLYTGGDVSPVKLITIAPERAGSEAFIKRARSAGIHVSLGHTAADAEKVHEAADWGADHATHLFNAMTPLKHREPGVPGAALTDDRLYCEMICDGVHLHRDVIRLIVRAKGFDRTVAITDAMEAAGMPDGEYELGGQKVFVRGNEARLRDGTLAGSVLTMPKALENLIHRFDIAPAAACKMCTSAPAVSIGEKLMGRILPGAPAMMTVWTKDWHMKRVVNAT